MYTKNLIAILFNQFIIVKRISNYAEANLTNL